MCVAVSPKTVSTLKRDRVIYRARRVLISARSSPTNAMLLSSLEQRTSSNQVKNLCFFEGCLAGCSEMGERIQKEILQPDHDQKNHLFPFRLPTCMYLLSSRLFCIWYELEAPVQCEL
mmetsp:Transcript_12959/g.24185  ORF Transcript_12959/g.24185 Transcript_12959/m.24185 type:complete len:118 (-) Transcript_12959:1672-2025(-)